MAVIDKWVSVAKASAVAVVVEAVVAADIAQQQ